MEKNGLSQLNKTISATNAVVTVTGDRAKKLQQDRATKTRHSSFITERSTDSVTSKGQKVSLTELKKHLCYIQSCNNFLSTFCTSW